MSQNKPLAEESNLCQVFCYSNKKKIGTRNTVTAITIHEYGKELLEWFSGKGWQSQEE